jgi:hypothetical protein
LKIYSQYASAHASSLDAVSQCREKYPMFQKFLEVKQKKKKERKERKERKEEVKRGKKEEE